MLVEISIVIIAAFIVVFVIGMLILLFQIRKTAREAEKFIETARQHIAPLSHDMAIIVNDSKKIVSSTKEQVEKIEQGVEAIRDTAFNLKSFEMEIQDRIQQPVVETASYIAAFLKVLYSVVKIFSKDKKKK